MQITKKQIWNIVIVLYMVISLGYILYTAWSNFKINYGQRSYEQGRQDTVQQLIQQATQPDCKPFTVYADQKQVQLQNSDCSAVPVPADQQPAQ